VCSDEHVLEPGAPTRRSRPDQGLVAVSLRLLQLHAEVALTLASHALGGEEIEVL
jgi:hypothetical protein